MDLIDDSKAGDYVGKVVLVGVTYLDHEDKPLDQKQWAGTISAFSRKEGIKIVVPGLDKPLVLPPAEKGIRKASPGVYRLRSTGEEIENPDYLATWTCVSPDPNKKEPNQPPEPMPLKRHGSP